MNQAGLSIAARLAHLTSAPKKPAAPRSRLDALITPSESEFGPLYLRETNVGPAREVSPASLAALALSEVPLDTSRPLYFDTETTGLAGGTGTLAFLLGTAEIRAGEVIVSQVHLPGPGQERPMLQWLAARIEASTMLLSFNGRSFDWPLLKSRFVMNRLPVPPERPHVDLLHCARRVFRHHLEELKLSTLEKRVLDVQRHGDIDGALIPTAWFDFLRTGRVAILARVLSHNERDVRSMVDLVNRLTAAWEERHPVLPPTALGLATVAARYGDLDRAHRFISLALRERVGVRADPLVIEAASALEAELRRKNAEWSESVEALQRAVANSKEAARHHLRLAKIYEHRLRDYEKARQHAELCAAAEGPESHARRRARIAHALTPTLSRGERETVSVEAVAGLAR